MSAHSAHFFSSFWLTALMPELTIKMRQWGNYRPINNSCFARGESFAKATNTGTAVNADDCYFFTIKFLAKQFLKIKFLVIKLLTIKFLAKNTWNFFCKQVFGDKVFGNQFFGDKVCHSGIQALLVNADC